MVGYYLFVSDDLRTSQSNADLNLDTDHRDMDQHTGSFWNVIVGPDLGVFFIAAAVVWFPRTRSVHVFSFQVTSVADLALAASVV